MKMSELVGKKIKIEKKAKLIKSAAGFCFNLQGRMDYIAGNEYTVIDYDGRDDSVCIPRETDHAYPTFRGENVWFIDRNWIESVDGEPFVAEEEA